MLNAVSNQTGLRGGVLHKGAALGQFPASTKAGLGTVPGSHGKRTAGRSLLLGDLQ